MTLWRGWAHLPRTFGLLTDSWPRWPLTAVCTVLEGLAPVAIVHFTRQAVEAFGAGGGLLLSALPVGLAFALAEGLRALGRWTRLSASRTLQDHITDLVQKKSVEVELEFYDTPAFYDHLHRARGEATYRPAALVEAAAGLLAAAVTATGIALLLVRFGWWMPFALGAASLPALAVLIHYRYTEHRRRSRLAPEERRVWYLEWLLCGRETAAEIRLFGLGDRFRTESTVLRRRMRAEETSHAASQGRAEAAAAVGALAVAGAAVYWFAGPRLPLADLVLLYQSVQYGLGVVRGLLENAGALYTNSHFLDNLYSFLDLPAAAAPEHPIPAPRHLSHGIDLRNVTFRYAGTQHDALRGLSLTIRAGETTAIVGWNGAGKSTLLKLLCGFYRPSAGVIEVDGVDLRRIQPVQWHQAVTALFQHPVRYNSTASDNIGFGRVGLEQVEQAAREAGAVRLIEDLPGRYGQLLGSNFATGVELSGGQWQRIALARALCRPAALLLLDEPTSALDPWSESEWLGALPRLGRGRTVVLVTHRFSTARAADRVIVLDHGEVVEQGTHEQLLRLGGRYAQAWHNQVREGVAR